VHTVLLIILYKAGFGDFDLREILCNKGEDIALTECSFLNVEEEMLWSNTEINGRIHILFGENRPCGPTVTPNTEISQYAGYKRIAKHLDIPRYF
jgi:hypothetical protein